MLPSWVTLLFKYQQFVEQLFCELAAEIIESNNLLISRDGRGHNAKSIEFVKFLNMKFKFVLPNFETFYSFLHICHYHIFSTKLLQMLILTFILGVPCIPKSKPYLEIRHVLVHIETDCAF